MILRSDIPQQELYLLSAMLYGAAYVASPKRVLDPETGKDMSYLKFGAESAKQLFESFGIGSMEGTTVTSQAHALVEKIAEAAELRVAIQNAYARLEPLSQTKAGAEGLALLRPHLSKFKPPV